MASTERTEGAREAILDAALLRFATQGYADTTLKQIAETAGLKSAANLYYYFPKKEDLLREVLVQFLVLDTELLHLDEFDDPPRVALARLMERHLAEYSKPRRVMAFRVIDVELPRIATMGLDLSAISFQEIFTRLEAYLDHHIALGNLRPVPAAHVSRAILGILTFHIQTRYNPVVPPVWDDQEVIRHALDIVLGGIEVQ